MRSRLTLAAAIAIAGVVAGLTACSRGADVEAPPDVRAQVDDLVRAGAPGAILLVRHGDREYAVTAGVADKRSRAAMRPEATFRIGSLTKTFVATVVLQLAGEGRVKLDRAVARYLPGLVPNGYGITVRQLMNHSSGLFSYTDDGSFLQPYRDGKLRYYWSPRRLLKVAASHPALFDPGSYYGYSNTNYVVLGLLIQRLTGTSVGEQLQNRLIWPLHLDSTRFPRNDLDLPPEVHGYTSSLRGGLRDTQSLSSSYAWSAGALTSDVTDVADFYRALLGGQLLPRRLLTEMETPAPRSPAYGLGLQRFTTPCGPAWGHDGNFPGYPVFARTSADGETQVVLFTNSDTPTVLQQLPRVLRAIMREAYCAK